MALVKQISLLPLWAFVVLGGELLAQTRIEAVAEYRRNYDPSQEMLLTGAGILALVVFLFLLRWIKNRFFKSSPPKRETKGRNRQPDFKDFL